jgi:hypothetical protein
MKFLNFEHGGVGYVAVPRMMKCEKTGTVIFKGKHALANGMRKIRRQWYPTHANDQIVISSLAKSRESLHGNATNICET